MKIRANVSKVQDENSRVKAYADITVENCCKFNGMRVVMGKDNNLFVRYPQKPAYEHGQPKLDENGKQIYTDVYWGTKEVNDAIKALVLEAYNSPNGYAYLNPEEGEKINAMIEPQLHACNGEVTKAAGRLLVGGYMKVSDVFVNLRTTKEGEPFLSVSYPHYKSGEGYRDFVEPLEKGRIWDGATQSEKEYNFRRALEGAMKKQTREFHPELDELLKGNLDERLAGANAQAKENNKEGKLEAMDAPDMAMPF